MKAGEDEMVRIQMQPVRVRAKTVGHAQTRPLRAEWLVGYRGVGGLRRGCKGLEGTIHHSWGHRTQEGQQEDKGRCISQGSPEKQNG